MVYRIELIGFLSVILYVVSSGGQSVVNGRNRILYSLPSCSPPECCGVLILEIMKPIKQSGTNK